ncbi:hypothetical protein DK26_14905 [Bosea sp. WAO]|uniref:hypothetical protein n=1 Tax=Bosea sp. WAO TaxID=406341 RepID=UPI000749229A|nr:hypothetical protein [Bosea sp. WAO]KUL94304.1 hypothetical protein DK26_14905 [Bosea sp. WAO]
MLAILDRAAIHRARNAFHTARHRLRYRLERYGRALRYARSAMTADDAHQFIYEAEYRAGHYSLAAFTVAEVMDAAAERWGNVPGMQRWAVDAAARVSGKWNDDTSELPGAACEWALQIMQEYAAADGVQLVEQDEDDEGEEA